MPAGFIYNCGHCGVEVKDINEEVCSIECLKQYRIHLKVKNEIIDGCLDGLRSSLDEIPEPPLRKAIQEIIRDIEKLVKRSTPIEFIPK